MSMLLFAALLLSGHGATVEGSVTTSGSRVPLVGATVAIPQLDREVRTDAEGRFVLLDVPPGRWRTTATHPGYQEVTLYFVAPEEGTLRVHFELTPIEAAAAVPILTGRVVEAGSGHVVPAAEVIIGSRRTITDLQGWFEVPIDGGEPLSVRAWAYGYLPLDTVTVEAPVGPLLLSLRASPVRLPAVSVEVGGKAAAAEKSLFEQEPRPGVVGATREVLNAVPPMIEADVLRSIQALPGVVQLNDLSARLHVRGGGPDQNLMLLDGVPIFAPYHLFGMMGAINPSAVARVDFFRGDLPARYGGALSSVLEVSLRDDAERWLQAEAGLSILSGKLTARGILPIGQGRWLVSGRRSFLKEALGSVFGSGPDADVFPATFSDLHLRMSLEPKARHRLSGTYFRSDDAFRMILGMGDALESDWHNQLASLRWETELGGQWSAAAMVWHSEYQVGLGVGVGESAPRSSGVTDLSGLRVEGRRRGSAMGVRVGLELQGGSIGLTGGNHPGGYIVGSVLQPRGWAAGYGELDHEIGRLRLSPGLRVESGEGRGSLYASPRLAGRLRLREELALTFGASRNYQALSTLRDDRYALPGPPFWFAHSPEQPLSRADGVSAALEGWIGELWSFSATGYARSFTDLPVWRPEGTRTVSGLQWHDGDARGMEFMVRRHAESLHGWLSYGFSRSTMRDTLGAAYQPVWDRTHAVDLAVFVRGNRLTTGARISYGSGAPFWSQAGVTPAHTFSPTTGRIEQREPFPLWSESQLRYPAHVRVDLTASMELSVGRFGFRPYLGLLNALGRENVLLYEYAEVGRVGESPQFGLRPVTALPPFIPSIGFDATF